MHESLKKRCIVALVLALVLSCLLYAPIRMGTGVNKDIPLIGAAESVAENYCEQTLIAATKAYVAAKLIDKCISTLQQVEISFTPFGMGVTVAPGEMLAAVNEAIERVSSALFHSHRYHAGGKAAPGHALLGQLQSAFTGRSGLWHFVLCGRTVYALESVHRPVLGQYCLAVLVVLAIDRSGQRLCWRGISGGVYAQQMEKVEGS